MCAPAITPACGSPAARRSRSSRWTTPLRDDPVAAIDESCVGCGNCGEVAEAAVLCPSFHRVDIVRNPGVGERIAARLSGAAIGWLQARRDRRRLVFGEGA